MEINRIAVIGAGQMGAGITQVCAQAGLPVWMHDVSMVVVERGLERIGRQLDRAVAKGKLGVDERDAILGRITPVTSLRAVADADLVIEAVTENTSIKQQVFRELDDVCKPSAVLASNTSTISITLLGAATRRPEQVIGMHFFIPAPVMPLVEVIKGLRTREEVAAAIRQLARQLGKQPVDAPDYAGFIVNRILVPMINDAINLVMEGVKPTDIDAGMKLGCNHPMGPLELADFVGLDTLLAVMEVLYENFRDPKYRPSPLLRKMVEAGLLGRKTGRGFYEYADA